MKQTYMIQKISVYQRYLNGFEFNLTLYLKKTLYLMIKKASRCCFNNAWNGL